MTTDGTGNAILPHSSDKRQIFVKDLIHKWDISRGWPGKGAVKTWVAGGHRKNFPVQEAASWVSFCTPGRCHMVCDDEAHREEPTGQSQAAPGPRRSGPAQVTGQQEQREGGGPPHITPGGTRCCFKVAMLVCSRPRSSHRTGVCKASCLEQRE